LIHVQYLVFCDGSIIAMRRMVQKLGGDVYVVASEKKIYDKDGKAVDLF